VVKIRKYSLQVLSFPVAHQESDGKPASPRKIHGIRFDIYDHLTLHHLKCQNMKNVEVTSSYTVFDSINELSSFEQQTMQKAIEMLDHVYAPYSEFQVGSAVMTQSGSIYGGCNQENASYPLCICGERVALYNAGVNEPKTPIKVLAIACRNPHKKIEKPVSPCGACRQVISEFEKRHEQTFPILLKGDSDIIYKIASASTLLPFGFDDSYL